MESQLPSATNSILLNSGLSATNTHLLSTEAEDTFMERECTAESLSRRYCNGAIVAPITYLDRHNAAQFEIIGLDRYLKDNPKYGHRFTIRNKEKYARLIIRKVL